MIRENISQQKKQWQGFWHLNYGICFGYWHHLSAEMKKMMEERQYLLDYALDRKTKIDQKIQKDFRTSSYMYGNKDISVYTKAILWKNKSKKGEIRVWL